MKPKLFLLPAVVILVLLLAFRIERERSTAAVDWRAFKEKNIVRCSPDWNALGQWLDEEDIPPMPGAGSYQWPVTTNNDSARFYFSQGINMYYGFHIIEAMASFKKAARFDPDAAMLQWAQALAYGPNINDLGYAASPDALLAINKAVELAANGSEKEKILIAAQQVRYSADSTESRTNLNQLYADKMKEAYEKFPDDADIAALYADALMLQHPWELWETDGQPKPWTPLIREVLEKLLAKHPNHPGANHYYIHVMEPSPYASLALPSADRLGQLSPGLSHLVHMPSHIYLRTGDYGKGAKVNELAVKSYQQYLALYPAVAANDFLYIIHNLHMQTNNAIMAGQAAYSLQSAMATINSLPKDYLAAPGALGNYIQYIYMTPLLVQVRFGMWNELLQMAAPDTSLKYARVLFHFGRGMALLRTSQPAAAAKELELLQQQMKDSSLLVPLAPFSAAIEGAMIAENLLKGSILLEAKGFPAAIEAFSKAVTTEENMVYNEPRDWLLNPKHYLGNAYLQEKKYAEARKVFEKDLLNNQENVWALLGLYTALKAGGNKKETGLVLQRFQKALQFSDRKDLRPVY